MNRARSCIGRRWWFGVAATLVVVGVIMCSRRHDPETAHLDGVMAQIALRASAEARPLFLEAGQVARDLLRDFPNDADALDAVARLYQRCNKSEDAVRCWQRCIELRPELAAAAHASIASVAFDTGDLATAAEHYRVAMQQDPTSPTHPVGLGEALVNQGKHEEAVRVLEQELHSHPRSMPAHSLLGQAYLRLRQYDKARRHLESSVRISPDYPAAYHGLMAACAQLGEKEKAKEYGKRFQELQSQEEKRHRQDLKTRDDVAKLHSIVANTCADAARIYIVRGDLPTGESRLLRARELLPTGSPWLLMLAGLYEQQGRRDDALATLADASQQASEELSTQLHVAFAYSRLGSSDKAEDAYRRVIELAPHQGSSYAALAQFYLHVGRKLPQAADLAEKAVALDPVREYWFLLSQARLQNGDARAAQQAIDRALGTP